MNVYSQHSNYGCSAPTRPPVTMQPVLLVMPVRNTEYQSAVTKQTKYLAPILSYATYPLPAKFSYHTSSRLYRCEDATQANDKSGKNMMIAARARRGERERNAKIQQFKRLGIGRFSMQSCCFHSYSAAVSGRIDVDRFTPASFDRGPLAAPYDLTGFRQGWFRSHSFGLPVA